jgi:hypothetical protein
MAPADQGRKIRDDANIFIASGQPHQKEDTRRGISCLFCDMTKDCVTALPPCAALSLFLTPVDRYMKGEQQETT